MTSSHRLTQANNFFNESKIASAGFQQMSTVTKVTDQSSFGVVNLGYNSPDQNVPNRSGEMFVSPQQIGMQVLQPMTGGPTVVVTQPVVTVPEPQTQCALIMSVLSSIFCCFMFGIVGILVSWRARLYVLENKFEHARHSVNIVWILFALTIFFGIITWATGVYVVGGVILS